MKKVFTYILKLSARFLLFLFEMVLFFIALFAILTAVESCSPDVKFALDKDMCFDDGNVWDYDENRCREDCYTWTQQHGCIQMSREHFQMMQYCRANDEQCDLQQLYKYHLELCQKYNVPINPLTGKCEFK